MPTGQHDLAAVRAVGVPDGGTGVAGHAETALVHRGVVALAQQRSVLAARRPAVGPVDDVVDVAPGGRGRTACEDAVPVAQLDRPADGRGRGALCPTAVEREPVGPGDHPPHARVAGPPPAGPSWRAGRRAVSGRSGRARGSSPPPAPATPRSEHSASTSMLTRT